MIIVNFQLLYWKISTLISFDNTRKILLNEFISWHIYVVIHVYKLLINNTKYNSPKYEHLADLSDSTLETIHTGRKKLRTGRTQFQRKNPININTVYNNNMKQNQVSKEPTNNNIKRNPNLIRKQNKYMGSIKKSKKQHSQQNKINPNPIK